MANVTGDIAVAWQGSHAAAGPLGAATDDAVVTGTGRYQLFEHGIIVSSKYGAHVIWGPPSVLYMWAGGPSKYHLAGDPSGVVCRIDNTPGSRSYLRSVEDDSEAYIFMRDVGGTPRLVIADPIGVRYNNDGGPEYYGYPVDSAPAEWVDGKTPTQRQKYEYGLITQQGATVRGAHSNSDYWIADDDFSWVVLRPTAPNVRGTLQTTFARSPDEQVTSFMRTDGFRFITYGSIGKEWWKDYGMLGDPIEDEHDGVGQIKRTQNFELGRIDWDGRFAIITHTDPPPRPPIPPPPPPPRVYQHVTVRVRPEPPFNPNAPANNLVTIASVHLNGSFPPHLASPVNAQAKVPGDLNSARLPWPAGTYATAVFTTIEAPVNATKVEAGIWVQVGDEATETANTVEIPVSIDWAPSAPVIIEVILNWANNAWHPKSARMVEK